MVHKRNTAKTQLPTEVQAERFDMLEPMLDSHLREVRDFSKKKQDGVLSKLKVSLINRVLTEVKEILKDDPSIDFLDLLDDETLPQNGDAVLILGQYQAAMKQFRSKYYGYVSRDSEHRWLTQERP